LASIEDRQCKHCNTKYGILTHRGESLGIERDDDGLTCPKCDKDDYKILIGVPLGVELGDEGSVGKFYPRWDRGLGCRVSSKQHRQKIMDERGLVALEGGAEVSSAQKEIWRQEDKDHRDYEKLIDKYDNAPEFSEYRRLKDRGAYDNWEN